MGQVIREVGLLWNGGLLWDMGDLFWDVGFLLDGVVYYEMGVGYLMGKVIMGYGSLLNGKCYRIMGHYRLDSLLWGVGLLWDEVGYYEIWDVMGQVMQWTGFHGMKEWKCVFMSHWLIMGWG